MDAFSHEETVLLTTLRDQKSALSRTQIMKRGWEGGNFFYFLALDSISGLYGIFLQNIQKTFGYPVKYDDFRRIVAPYFRRQSEEFVRAKVQQKHEYDKQLKKCCQLQL